MTNREFYAKVIATTEDAEIKAFAEGAIAKMDERNEKRKVTQTPNQKDNEILKGKFIDFLTANGQKSAAEVGAEFKVSTSKASSLLSQAVTAGTVGAVEVRVKGKGKHKEYFIPDTTEGEEA